MAKVKKTYGELLDLSRNINAAQIEKGTKAETKIKKIIEKIKPFIEQYNEKRDDIRLDNAYADANGVLDLTEKGEYKFTKEGIKQMTKSLKNLLDESFELYELTFSTEGIEHFDFLAGWVEGIKSEESEIEQLETISENQ